jgi:dynein heavy chain
MPLQVMHSQQVEAKKPVLSAVSQVDDMYDMLAAYEQKVSCMPRSRHNAMCDAWAAELHLCQHTT